MNKRLLVNKIRKEFPNLQWKIARHNVEGWDHYALILDNKYVFRFPRKMSYAKKLYSETQLLKYLRELKLTVPIPQYEFIAKDKSFAGYVMLQGSQMSKEEFNKVSAFAKNEIATQLATFLSVMHKIPLSTAKQYGAHLPDTREQYKELVKNVRKYIRPRMSKRNNILIKEYLKEFAKYQKYPTKCFTHSDLYPDHLILSKDKKRLSGIIDFADRGIYDPAADFAELWTYGEKFVNEVYKKYTGPKDKDFLHRSQLYRKRVPLWIMISPFLGMRGTFKMGYKLFKQIYLQRPA